MRQFKPFVAVVVVLTVAVIGWTIFSQASKRRAVFANSAMQVATAPPIAQGQAAPHPDWGTCTDCHQILPGKGGAKPAASTMSIATAPPVRLDQARPHPDWGACDTCHSIIGNKAPSGNAKAAAATAAPPLGIWLRPLTPAVANELGLVVTDGVLVSGVYSSAPANRAGLRIGDVISRIDDIDVDTVNDALTVIAQKGVHDTVKLQVVRNGKRMNIFIPISSNPQNQVPTSAPVVVANTAPATRIAVAATGAANDAQVAPAFSEAPVFVLYDPSTRSFSSLSNPNPGSLTAGVSATETLVGAGAGAVIVGRIGPSAMSRLRASGVRVYTGAFGSVQSVIAQYQSGNLIEATGSMLPQATPTAQAANRLIGKIAVAAQQPSLGSPVATSLSAAPFLIIYDLQTQEYEVVAKEPADTGGTASVQIAHLVVEHGAAAALAGDISPSTVQTLSSLGVFAFAGVTGSVTSAVDMVRAGTLRVTTIPTVSVRAQGVAPNDPGKLTF